MPMAFETEPFNGDVALAETVRKMASRYSGTWIETGTYKGVTTLEMAKMNRLFVFSVEKNQKLYNAASERMSTELGAWEDGGSIPGERWFRGPTAPAAVCLIHGDSRDVLSERIDPFPNLYYLDAHWGKDWPILGELEAIARAKPPPPVIIIHDFLVPGTDLGYDSYDGQDLDWDYVADAVEAIYGKDGYVRSHNDPETATGARRGVLILEPKV